MRQAERVDPAELRLSFRPYPEPMRWESTGSDGRPYTSIHYGALRIEWDSPTGKFTLMIDQRDDLGDAYEELRPHYAQMIAEAYAQAP